LSVSIKKNSKIKSYLFAIAGIKNLCPSLWSEEKIQKDKVGWLSMWSWVEYGKHNSPGFLPHK
jgi:hypothetical protein